MYLFTWISLSEINAIGFDFLRFNLWCLQFTEQTAASADVLHVFLCCRMQTGNKLSELVSLTITAKSRNQNINVFNLVFLRNLIF